jgi:hypothetical protein
MVSSFVPANETGTIESVFDYSNLGEDRTNKVEQNNGDEFPSG